MFAQKPMVMGIINATSDSFYAPSRVRGIDVAYEAAMLMIDEGASIIDIGGQSTRQYNGAIRHADTHDVEAEIERVIPVIEKLKAVTDVLISIDTQHARVMHEAIRAGVDCVNDIQAFQNEGALDVMAAAPGHITLVLMHRGRATATTPVKIDAIQAMLASRIEACVSVGIARERLWIDPGFGFDKTAEDNAHALVHLDALKALGQPILVGISRKSMFEVSVGCKLEARLPPSLSAATYAYLKGAHIFRCHDVKATVDALGFIHWMAQSVASA